MNEASINDKRQYNLDLLKAVAIISMVICHSVVELGWHNEGSENGIAYFVGNVILGEYIAVAHAFMFAMGVGTVFTEKNKPSDFIKRGIGIFVLGYVLNFLRYGVYALADGIIEGEFAEETVFALTVQDIFQFAGLALIATGVFRAIKLNEVQILGIGVALSIIGSFVAFMFKGGSVMNYMLGYFVITTEDDSCFAFLNWYIFVAVGIMFGSMVRKSNDLDGLYKKVIKISCPIMLLYIVMTLVLGTKFLTKNGWYYAVSTVEAIGLLSIDFTLLAGFYFLLKKVDESKVAPFITIGKNMSKIYIIHWCILGFIDSIFCYLLEIVFPYTAIYIFGVLLVIISSWIAKRWTLSKVPYIHH